MGSKIRNSVGSNFEEALRLLQLEIEKRLQENETPAESAGDATNNNKLHKKKGDKSSHKYELMAFSDASCHYSADKRLKLCSDYASSTDFLHYEKKDILQSYKHALLYNRHGQTSFVDHNAFICGFLEQLENDASDATTLEKTERTIREFVSCLVLSEVPARAASKVGELVGRYARVCFGLLSGHDHQMISVNNVISTSITVLPVSAESIASFVTGYIKCAMSEISDEARNKDIQRVFVSMAMVLSKALMQCTALQKLNVPAVDKRFLTQFNDAKAFMKKLLKWASDILPSDSNEESSSQNESPGGDTNEEDLAHDSEQDDENESEEEESEEEELGISLRRSKRKRK